MNFKSNTPTKEHHLKVYDLFIFCLAWLKKEQLIPYFFLMIFFIPWAILGLGQYEIKIKELAVIFVFAIFLIKYFMLNGGMYLDKAGRIYFFFILVAILYTLVELFKIDHTQDIYYIIHILFFTIINFIIYVIVFNANLNKFNLKYFVNMLIVIYISIFLYFVFYSIELHILGQKHIGGFYSVENELWQEGKLKIYFGGTNARGWFFLVLTSFLVGYFKNKKSYLKALSVIFMSILTSYLLLSRGATLFGFVLLGIYLLSFLKLSKAKSIIFFALLSLFAFTAITYISDISKGSIAVEAFEKKKKDGYSNRDKLVFDSLKIISDDFFIGRGFHYTNMNKKELREEGYMAIGHNNPQNTLLSIFIELGIVGVLLYIAFWVLLYKNISNTIKYLPLCIKQNYLSGVKMMILFIFFSSIFAHFIEKNFTSTPIYMIFLALAGKITYEIRKSIY